MKYVLAMVTAVTLICGAGCSVNPATGDNQLITVSASETAAMGEAAKPKLTKEYGGEVKSAELRGYVTGIGRKLLKHVEPEYADVKWEFTTLDSDVINAFALPGGKVFMSRGLMEFLNSEAAVAGVLGHEIGHVTGKHIDERLSQAMVIQGGGQLASAAAGSSSSGWSELIPLVVGVGGQGYLLKFGRDQESQADELGLRYMTKAGYDPEGMLDVITVLMNASEGGGPPEMLSTHPDPARRHREAEALIKKDYAFTIDNPEYQKFEARFKKSAVPHLDLKRSATRTGVTGPAATQYAWCSLCAAGSPLPPPWK